MGDSAAVAKKAGFADPTAEAEGMFDACGDGDFRGDGFFQNRTPVKPLRRDPVGPRSSTMR